MRPDYVSSPESSQRCIKEQTNFQTNDSFDPILFRESKHSALSICVRHPNEWLFWTGSFSESKTITNQTERLLNLIWLTYLLNRKLLLSPCPNRNEATAVTVLCCT